MATLAFVRSLISFHNAMVAAMGSPNPNGLASTVDLEAASETLAGARAWVAFLTDVERGTSGIITRAERSGFGDSPEAVKERTVLDFVSEARSRAEEHVAELRVTPRSKTAPRG